MGDNLYNHRDQLVLSCSSEGSPELEYTWLPPGNVNSITSTRSTLIIDNISNGGEYTCNMTNNFGTDSNTIIVHNELLLVYIAI